MTFVDDEIEKINAEKMAKITKDAKKHKPATPATNKVVKPEEQPHPPTLIINSIIGEVYEQSFPLLRDPQKGITDLVPQPIPMQPILENIVKMYRAGYEKAGKEFPESQAKAFAANLLNITREIAYFGLITLYKVNVDDVEDYYTYITPKGIIYANSLNYLASANPREHYAIYLQVASS